MAARRLASLLGASGALAGGVAAVSLTRTEHVRCGADHPQAPQAVSRVLHHNPRLRVLDMRLGAGAAHEVHHDVPTVRWQVLDADKTTPQPTFHAAGSRALISNPEAVERREIVFEVLGQPLYDEDEVKRLLSSPRWPTDVGSRLMLENPYVRMWDFRSSAGLERHAFHQHTLDNAFVLIADGTLDLYQPDPDDESRAKFLRQIDLKDGQVVFTTVATGGFEADGVTSITPGCLHSVENACASEFREYLIELK